MHTRHTEKAAIAAGDWHTVRAWIADHGVDAPVTRSGRSVLSLAAEASFHTSAPTLAKTFRCGWGPWCLDTRLARLPYGSKCQHALIGWDSSSELKLSMRAWQQMTSHVTWKESMPTQLGSFPRWSRSIMEKTLCRSWPWGMFDTCSNDYISQALLDADVAPDGPYDIFGNACRPQHLHSAWSVCTASVRLKQIHARSWNTVGNIPCQWCSELLSLK
eukprot:4956522-Amphidinium_carterae.1